MQILVDADACPVVALTEKIAAVHRVPVTLFCDTNHVLRSDYASVRIISAGRDAVDLALINASHAGDVVITQDYGVAALAFGKGAHALHQNGMRYTADNIDFLLHDRHMSAKARRAHGKTHLRGPKRRTEEDDRRFADALEKLLLAVAAP